MKRPSLQFVQGLVCNVEVAQQARYDVYTIRLNTARVAVYSSVPPSDVHLELPRELGKYVSNCYSKSAGEIGCAGAGGGGGIYVPD